MNGMALQFSRVVSPVEDMEIWNASSNGFSFVIVMRAAAVPAFTDAASPGRGHTASWRRGGRSIRTGAL